MLSAGENSVSPVKAPLPGVELQIGFEVGERIDAHPIVGASYPVMVGSDAEVRVGANFSNFVVTKPRLGQDLTTGVSALQIGLDIRWYPFGRSSPFFSPSVMIGRGRVNEDDFSTYVGVNTAKIQLGIPMPISGLMVMAEWGLNMVVNHSSGDIRVMKKEEQISDPMMGVRLAGQF